MNKMILNKIFIICILVIAVSGLYFGYREMMIKDMSSEMKSIPTNVVPTNQLLDIEGIYKINSTSSETTLYIKKISDKSYRFLSTLKESFVDSKGNVAENFNYSYDGDLVVGDDNVADFKIGECTGSVNIINDQDDIVELIFKINSTTGCYIKNLSGVYKNIKTNQNSGDFDGDIAGKYTLFINGKKNDSSSFEVNKNADGKFIVKGGSFWDGSYSTNVGEISGELNILSGGTKNNTLGYYKVGHCEVFFNFSSFKSVEVVDNLKCGGLNVSFTGKYKIIKQNTESGKEWLIIRSGDKNISLLNYISDIYSNKKYSENNKPSCIKTLKKISEIEDYKIDKKACPDIYDYDFFAKPYDQTTLEEYVVINDFFNNSKPIERYLFSERETSSSSRLYREVYSRFVYAKTINDIPERLNDLYDMEYDRSLAGMLNFDFKKFSPDVDLVLVTDKSSSGAYNFVNFLYQLNFTKDGIDFIDPLIVDDLTHYSRSNTDDLTNSYFNYDDDKFSIYGFKPFGLFPCNITKTYSFIDNKLILTSKKQAKDCNKYNIEGLNDIPDNFDSTLVEIYKISEDLLEKIKKIKI